MRKLMGCLIAAAALVALPQVVLAQRARASSSGGAKNEFGVDLGAAFGHVGGGCTANCGTFVAGTSTADLRVGFITGSMSVEPRLSFSYVSAAGGHELVFSPDVNLLKPMGSSTARKGLYLTGGLGLNVFSASGVSSENQFSLNAGAGTRIPFESNAWRVEGFFKYAFKSGILANTWNLGARIGMSFWR